MEISIISFITSKYFFLILSKVRFIEVFTRGNIELKLEFID